MGTMHEVHQEYGEANWCNYMGYSMGVRTECTKCTVGGTTECNTCGCDVFAVHGVHSMKCVCHVGLLCGCSARGALQCTKGIIVHEGQPSPTVTPFLGVRLGGFAQNTTLR